MLNKVKEWSGVVALVAIILFLILGQGDAQVGSGSRFPNGLSADSTSPVAGELRGSTLTITGAATTTGKAVFDGGVVHSNTNSTSTAVTAYTLVANDIAPNGAPYSAVVITPNGGDLALTFPASSTLAAFLPSAGDWTEQCWRNASTTSGIDITFAAGTGIDLEVATTSPSAQANAVLTVLADAGACIKYQRKPATAAAFDIAVMLTRFLDGD